MPQTAALEAGFNRTRKTILVVGAALILIVLVVGWSGDYRSCRRSQPIREEQIETREINRQAIPFWNARGEVEIADRLQQRVEAAEDITQLDCTQLLPGV